MISHSVYSAASKHSRAGAERVRTEARELGAMGSALQFPIRARCLPPSHKPGSHFCLLSHSLQLPVPPLHWEGSPSHRTSVFPCNLQEWQGERWHVEGSEGGGSAGIWDRNVAGRWDRCSGGSLLGMFNEQQGGQGGQS